MRRILHQCTALLIIPAFLATTVLAVGPGTLLAAQPAAAVPADGIGVQSGTADEYDVLFDELESQQDLQLAEQEASGLSGGELVVSIIFLILFFPLGLILLIIFLVDDDD